MSLVLAIAVCACLGAVAWLATPTILRRLPEPPLEPGESKIPYAQLPASRLAFGAAVWTLALSLATTAALPVEQWAPSLVVALAGSIGCIIDAATTWLPKRILHVGWGLSLTAFVGATLGGGGSAAQWWAFGRALAGAAIVGALLLIAHVVASFGLSDARLGLLTGAISAWVSWATLLNSLVIGSLVGAAWGVTHALRHGRSSPFPYGPSLLFGPYLAVLLAAATG